MLQKLKAPRGAREYYTVSGHRFFKWQMASDQVISLALMAYHRGASIRGIQVTVKEVFRVQPCAESVIHWYRKFAKKACQICANSKRIQNVRFCSRRGLVTSLEEKCRFFLPTLLNSETLQLVENFFKTSSDWKPYGKVGHPGRLAKFDQKEWERRYAREYYATHPDYAKTMVKHPEKLYSRLKIRNLSPEERLERKRKYHREWARERYRELKGGKIDPEMSRRGRKGAEVRFGRKYGPNDGSGA